MVTINPSLALTIQAQRHQTQTSLSIAMERLSSGLRVNSAKDDAAGLGIANRMQANLHAGNQIRRGINDGISLLQTAEGGLNNINALLHRSRELAVQAANGTLSDADRAFINLEYQELRDEIDRIAIDTEVFGKHPLAPTDIPPPETQLGITKNIKDRFTSGVEVKNIDSGILPLGFIPEGAKDITITIDSHLNDDDIQIFTRDGLHLIGTQVEGETDFVWQKNGVYSGAQLAAQAFSEENGFLPKAEYSAEELLINTHYAPDGGEAKHYKGMQLTYSGDGDNFDNGPGNGQTNQRIERLHIDETTEPLILVVAGDGHFDATVTWGRIPDTATPPPEPTPTSSATDIVMSANYGNEINKLTIDPTPADSISLGVDNVELATMKGATAALAKLDAALAKIDRYRGQYGALHNRFEGAIENLGQQQLNTAAARSRIVDTHYAQEVANMTKTQILQQAGNSLLAQANQLPQTVLALLS